MCDVFWLAHFRKKSGNEETSGIGWRKKNKQNLYLEVWSWSECHDTVIPLGKKKVHQTKTQSESLKSYSYMDTQGGSY